MNGSSSRSDLGAQTSRDGGPFCSLRMPLSEVPHLSDRPSGPKESLFRLCPPFFHMARFSAFTGLHLQGTCSPTLWVNLCASQIVNRFAMHQLPSLISVCLSFPSSNDESPIGRPKHTHVFPRFAEAAEHCCLNSAILMRVCSSSVNSYLVSLTLTLVGGSENSLGRAAHADSRLHVSLGSHMSSPSLLKCHVLWSSIRTCLLPPCSKVNSKSVKKCRNAFHTSMSKVDIESAYSAVKRNDDRVVELLLTCSPALIGYL
jgi:hypothetical protein